eukprot:261897-Amphidinium_carterae.1
MQDLFCHRSWLGRLQPEAGAVACWKFPTLTWCTCTMFCIVLLSSSNLTNCKNPNLLKHEPLGWLTKP